MDRMQDSQPKRNMWTFSETTESLPADVVPDEQLSPEEESRRVRFADSDMLESVHFIPNRDDIKRIVAGQQVCKSQ